MYEVSLAFARPASIGARGDRRRQARFGIAGKRLWATLDALLGSPRRRPSQPSNGPLLEIVRALALSIVRDRYADFGPTLAAEKLAEHHGCSVR